MIDTLTTGPQILIGSSMGGWLALLVAKYRPQRLRALIGIAAAPDFTLDLIPHKLGASGLAALKADGVYYEPTPYGPDPYIWTQLLFDDAAQHRVLDGNLTLPCPLHLIQGQQDPDVPWAHGIKIIENVSAPQMHLSLIADGDHRLSREQDLDLICEIVNRYAG